MCYAHVRYRAQRKNRIEIDETSTKKQSNFQLSTLEKIILEGLRVSAEKN